MSFTITIKLLFIKIQAKENQYTTKIVQFHQKWREQRNKSMNRNVMRP